MVQRIVPDLGVGAGLRVPHYRTVIEQYPAIDFFEIISENFMAEGGKPRFHLERVLEHYPLIQHGVSLGIGSPGELDWAYLKRLKALTQRVKPAWLSDHLCWTRADGVDLHDLLPLPYTMEQAKRVAERARIVQDYLELPFALENTSSYLAYRASTMSEWDFVSEVCERANIGLLFDVNNVFVAAYNHGFDAAEFVRNVPHERILQIHVAGHTHRGKYLLDTHNGNVVAPVWDLYRATIELAGAVSTLVEWDDEVPEFAELAALVAKTKAVRAEALAAREARTAERREERAAGPNVVTHSFESAQREMAEQLRSLRSVAKNTEAQAFATATIADNARLFAAEQLEIYREQFWLRHTASLLEDFPGVAGILGQAAWEGLVESYLVQHPPSGWSLRDLGQHFAAHLGARPETPHQAVCVDMARLEWAYIEIFDAADSAALSAEKLRSLSPEAWQAARFVLSPASHLLNLRYPVAELRSTLRASAAQHSDAEVLIPMPEPCRYLLYRSADRSLSFERLSVTAFELLVRLQRGEGLVPACEDVVQQWPAAEAVFESELFTWFGSWAERGIIAEVEVGTPRTSTP